MKILHRDRDEPAGPGFDGQRPVGTRMAARRRRRHRTRILLVVGLLIVVVGGLIAADYVMYRGKIHPGVRVAGTELNGQTREEAIATLTALADRTGATPLNLTYEGQTFTTTPAEMGWEPDIEATADEALRATSGRSPWEDLWNRMRAWVTPVGVAWEGTFDDDRAGPVIVAWSEEVGRDPVEGKVTVQGTVVQTSEPVEGVEVDSDAVLELAEDLVLGRIQGPQPLPVRAIPTETSPADVAAAKDAADLLMAGPIAAKLGKLDITLQPDELGPLVRSVVEPEPVAPTEGDVGTSAPPPDITDPGNSRIVLQLRVEGVADLLAPFAEQVEQEPTDAQFIVTGDRVRIKPSKPGKRLDPETAANRILAISRKPDRHGMLPLMVEEALLSTEKAEGLGIEELVGSFTTYHSCCEPRVTNIHLGADNLDGTIVMPGETFSLNETLGQRTYEKGYVDAPGILNGVIVPSVGGGISQLTTTTFNAAFFGGYPITDWKAHSFYFSRYPLGREATLSWPAPDLKFKNDTDHALLIKTAYTDVSITVKIFSTKIRQVAALDPQITSRTDTGYWTLVVRVIKDLQGNEIGRDEFRTFYKNGVPPSEAEASASANASSSPPGDTG